MTEVEIGPSLEIRVRLSFWNYYSGVLKNLLKPPLGIVLGVLFVLVSWTNFADRGMPVDALFFAGLVFVAPGLLVLWQLRRRRGKRETYRFSDTGIEVEYATGKALLRWSALKNANESRGYFRIFVSNRRGGFLIPKNQLTAAELTSVRSFLRKHLNAKAHLQP
jgi:hypothetical protein